MIRDWTTTDPSGVVLLGLLCRFYWDLSDINSKVFEISKLSLRQKQPRLALVQNPMQRVDCWYFTGTFILIESTTAFVAESHFKRGHYKMPYAARLEYQLASLHRWTTDVSGQALGVLS